MGLETTPVLPINTQTGRLLSDYQKGDNYNLAQEVTKNPYMMKDRIVRDEASLEDALKLEERLKIKRYPVNVTGSNLPRIMKDPCFIVRDNQVLVLGTQGDNDTDNLGVLTARGETLTQLHYTGSLQPEFLAVADRSDFCAAGAINDPESGLIVAAVQTLCFKEGGQIELISSLDGKSSNHERTLFRGVPNTPRSVIYDPHLFRWNDQWMMSLNIGPRLRESNVFVARSSGSWNDEWEVYDRPVLTSNDCPVQAKSHQEWNKEGSNITQLDSTLAAMIAVGFVEPGKFGSTEQFGTLQRITLHAAPSPLERFIGLSIPLLDPRLENDKTPITEIGHPAFVTNEQGRLYEENGNIFMSYQGRNTEDYRWRYFLASMNKGKLMELAEEITYQEYNIFNSSEALAAD